MCEWCDAHRNTIRYFERTLSQRFTTGNQFAPERYRLIYRKLHETLSGDVVKHTKDALAELRVFNTPRCSGGPATECSSDADCSSASLGVCESGMTRCEGLPSRQCVNDGDCQRAGPCTFDASRYLPALNGLADYRDNLLKPDPRPQILALLEVEPSLTQTQSLSYEALRVQLRGLKNYLSLLPLDRMDTQINTTLGYLDPETLEVQPLIDAVQLIRGAIIAVPFAVCSSGWMLQG